MRTEKKHTWHIEGGMKKGRHLDVPIHASPFLIGRDLGCHLTMSAPSVSRKHMQLELDGNKIYASDLGSTNGTFVNRNKLTGRIEIKSGDTLHLGEEELRIISQAVLNDSNEFMADDPSNSTVMMSINDPMLDLKNDFVRQEKEFNSMMATGDMHVAFLPIVSLFECKVIGYEALARGIRDDLPNSPGGLFNIAEKLGKARELSSAIRTRSLKACHALPGTPLIFVNTHPVEDLNSGLKDNITEMRKATSPWRIVLEVHESAVTNTRMILELKAILRDHEMYLAYDDFGAGQARWNELVEAPPDYLKFDMQLIHDIHKKSGQKQEMIRKLVEICLDQGAYPLAECVENDEELAICRQIGFTHGQGWLFGKPAPASSFNT